MFRKLILAVAVLPFIQGCSTSPMAQHKEADLIGKSKALQIATAGNCGQHLKDVSPDNMADALGYTRKPGVGSATMAADVTAALFSGGLSSLTGAFLFNMFLPVGAPASSYNCLIAWVPKEEAASPDEARRLLFESAKKAAIENLPEGYEWSVKTERDDKHVLQMFYTLKGNGCKGDGDCRIDTIIKRMPAEVTSPSVTGGYKAYKIYGHEAWVAFRKGGMENDELMSYYRNVSKDLPSWAYLYLGTLQSGFPFPVVLNQGEIHYFISPGA